jgi:hypothetical protein
VSGSLDWATAKLLAFRDLMSDLFNSEASP